jgi:hypothetical protein
MTQLNKSRQRVTKERKVPSDKKIVETDQITMSREQRPEICNTRYAQWRLTRYRLLYEVCSALSTEVA